MCPCITYCLCLCAYSNNKCMTAMFSSRTKHLSSVQQMSNQKKVFVGRVLAPPPFLKWKQAQSRGFGCSVGPCSISWQQESTLFTFGQQTPRRRAGGNTCHLARKQEPALTMVNFILCLPVPRKDPVISSFFAWSNRGGGLHSLIESQAMPRI